MTSDRSDTVTWKGHKIVAMPARKMTRAASVECNRFLIVCRLQKLILVLTKPRISKLLLLSLPGHDQPTLRVVAARMMSTSSGKEVSLDLVNGKGLIKLNRPKALNALNLNMINQMYPILKVCMISANRARRVKFFIITKSCHSKI